MHNDLGAVLKLLGRPADAAACFEAALARAPDFAEAHYNLGSALQALGRLEPAVERFTRALALEPGLAAAERDLGVALAHLGRFEAALAHCERALALQPGDLLARVTLANLLQALGRPPAELLAQLEPVLAARPGAGELHARVGMLRVQLGQLDAGCAALRRALEIGPESAALHCNLGVAQLALGDAETAVASFERALALDPALAAAHNDLGNALQALGALERAVASYRAALALQPDHLGVHNNLGIALAALGRPDEAIACYRSALARAPDDPDACNNMGTALAALGREAEALDWYAQALARNPQHAGALINQGNALKVLGRMDEARAALERALALAPRMARAHHALAELAPVRAAAPLGRALAALEPEADRLPAAERLYLHFALAKAYDDAGEVEPAFRHLAAGNALVRRATVYDEADTLARLARLEAVFTPDRLAARGDRAREDAPDDAPDEARPVFVVGMPRAGTTLVEQILASHPSVFGAGELDVMPALVKARATRRGTDYPDFVPALDDAALRALGADYLAAVAPSAGAAARITDKLPLNFMHVGLIHLALPRARIVHVRRDALDTCLSCFSKLFTGAQPFAYELGELGRYWRAYARAMAHWRAVLPAGVMLELDYEAVVVDLEAAARRLLAHCGLPWHDACLAFHRSARPVRTASQAQVRQPLYGGAVGRAERYRPWLGPLIEALEGNDRGC